MNARKRFCIWSAILLTACLLLEGVFFQLDALGSRGLTPVPIDLSAARIERQQLEDAPDDVAAVMPSTQTRKPVYRTTLVWDALEAADIRTAALTFDGDACRFDVKISLAQIAAEKSGLFRAVSNCLRRFATNRSARMQLIP